MLLPPEYSAFLIIFPIFYLQANKEKWHYLDVHIPPSPRYKTGVAFSDEKNHKAMLKWCEENSISVEICTMAV